jgi:hypothetical protein
MALRFEDLSPADQQRAVAGRLAQIREETGQARAVQRGRAAPMPLGLPPRPMRLAGESAEDRQARVEMEKQLRADRMAALDARARELQALADKGTGAGAPRRARRGKGKR